MLDELRGRLEEPTARGLARAVGGAVADGTLAPGVKLPPIRAVARELGLSPTTVSAAWSVLARSGTITTDGRRGTSVAAGRPEGVSRYRRALERGAHFEFDLSTGVPDPALLPDLGPSLRRLHATSAAETYLDEPLLPELLEHVAADWPFAAGSFTVVDGAMDALDLVIHQVVRFGQRVAVESPCFPPTLDLLESTGASLIPVRLDDDGPVPASVAAAVEAGAQALFLQPRAQNPTGASMTAERADEVARLLRDTEVLIVENDSAGAIASTPPVSLGRWLPLRTLHIRSYSKSHGPDLRLAALGGPPDLVAALIERRHLGQGWTSRLLQRILLDLLAHQPSVDQVQRARQEYARRREVLAVALRERGVRVGGRDGLNLWVPVADETAALVGLAGRGIRVAPGSPFLVRPEATAHLRVTAGLLEHGQAVVADALADSAGATPAGAWSGRR